LLDLLLNIILAWNEAFLDVNLSAANAAPSPPSCLLFEPEGLFWAKLSAASDARHAPILVLGGSPGSGWCED